MRSAPLPRSAEALGIPGRETAAAALLIISALLWLGLLLGVSFLATPVKFMADSLSVPVALDVGRHTFGVFSYVEIALAIILFISLTAARAGRAVTVAAVTLGVLVALQALWMLPVMDARVDLIMQGGTPPAARLHEIYIAFELSKLGLLVFVARRGFVAYVRAVHPAAAATHSD